MNERDAAAEVLADVRRIVQEVLADRAASVYLFGSWARGEVTSVSDIDLAIEPHAPLPPGTLAQLRERLEESHVPYRVDVVELTDVDPAFRRRVLEEGVLWSE
jgi:predicted nucleotidyltransferase